jgi:hypothetical protein
MQFDHLSHAFVQFMKLIAGSARPETSAPDNPGGVIPEFFPQGR